MMPALGGSERKLADIPRILNHARPTRADWGPDGEALIITDTSIDPPALALVSIETGDKMPFSAPPPKALGDFLPMVSPDGRWVAFVRVANVNASDWFLVPFSSDGRQEPRQLTSLKTMITGGTWTPKSTELVFSAQVEGIWRLLRISIDGSSPASRITEAGRDAFRLPSHAREDDWFMGFVTATRISGKWIFRIRARSRFGFSDLQRGRCSRTSPLMGPSWHSFHTAAGTGKCGLQMRTAPMRFKSPMPEQGRCRRGGRRTVAGWLSPRGREEMWMSTSLMRREARRND